MTLRKITVVFIAAAMVSIGFGMIFSDNAQAAFIEPLSGNGLNPNFIPYETAWNDAGTMAIVTGHGDFSTPHAYAYFPGNDTYFPLPNSNYNSNQILTGVDYSRELVIPKPKVLLVDADFNEEGGIVGAYQSALMACNADVTIWDVWMFGSINRGKPTAGTMGNYDVVIWVPSRDMNGFNGFGDAFNNVDENEVETYLNTYGGNFMLANIYYTDYTTGGSGSYSIGDFPYDYLGISYISNMYSMYDDYVNETMADAVYDGVGQCWLDWNQNGWTGSLDANDEIVPADGEICFYGTDSGMGSYYPMGIRYDDGPFKSVFFGFPFEVISSGSAQEAIMKKTLEWFMPGSQGQTRQSSALIVDADYHEEGIADAYNWSLTNNSWDVTIWDVYPGDTKPTSTDMAPYDLVVWVPSKNMDGAAGAGDAFNNVDEGQVSTYLDAGGNFFLSNAYWTDYTDGGSGSYMFGSFAYDYMGLDSVSNWNTDYEYALYGQGGDQVFDGFGDSYLDWNRFGWGGPYPYVTDTMSGMNGIECLSAWNDGFTNNGAVGVRYDSGSFKSMIMTLPFEVIPGTSSENADEFMYNLLEWYVPGSTSYNPELFTYQDVWWLCGDDAGAGINTAYRVVPSQGLQMQSVGTANVFQAVSCDHLGNPLFVSLGRNDMQYYDYLNRVWYSVTSALIMSDYDFHGIDFNENDRRFYIVGERNTNSMVTMWYTDPAPLDSGSAQTHEFNYIPVVDRILYSIAWNQALDYGLAVGDNMVYKILPYDYYGNGTLGYSVINNTFGIAYDVSWDTDGWNEAGIVGSDDVPGSGNARYWRYYDSNPILLNGYSTNPPTDFFTCGMKPPSSPKWLLIPTSGGGIRANILELDQSGEITLDVNQPHIFTLDMWKQNDFSKSSVLNSQVDADSTYTFFIEGNYTIGGMDHWTDLMISLTAWYDEGHIGGASIPEPSWNTPDNRTRQFNITYDVGSATPTIMYPVTGASMPEFSIYDFWEDTALYAADSSHHRLYINVTFGQQTFVASSNFGAGAAVAHTWDKNYALNDADSWDLQATMFSTVSTSARNVSFEEFGINEYASVSVVGSPGGSTPPGTANYAFTTPSQIYYSSNSQYYVNVSIPNLYKDGVLGPHFIPASDVAVRNTHSLAKPTNSDISTQIAFIGPNTNYSVWGTPGVPLQPVLNGTESAGPGYSDYTADSLSLAFEVTEVYWWITVPAGLPEGHYRATITFTIWH